MKITLINPAWLFIDKPIYLPQNLGLRYIASYLLSKGYKVTLIDALSLGFKYSQVVEINKCLYQKVGLRNIDVIKMIPVDTDYIGIGAPFTFLNSIVINLIDDIRKYFNIPIILGGVLPSTSFHLIREVADYYIIGEGEIPLEKFLAGQKVETIKGLSNKDFFNGQSEVIDDLDSIPFPFRNDFESHLSMSSRGRRNMKVASIITSRGCPYKCSFCSTHHISGFKWRARSVSNVIKEIEYLVNEFGINHFEIEDDNFSLDKERTKEILENIIKLNNKKNKLISFSTPNGLRIDTLDDEIMYLFKKANFESINLALESGDEEILVKMNKRMSLDKVIKVAQSASKYELPVLYFFMIGYPGETKRRFENSILFAKRLKEIGKGTSAFTTFITRAYPGTILFDECLAKGYIDDEVENEVFIGSKYNIVTPEFDELELKNRLKHANNVLNDGKKQDYLL